MRTWNKIILVLSRIILSRINHSLFTLETMYECEQTTQVGFAEFNNTADNRANIGGTIIGAPIVGQ